MSNTLDNIIEKNRRADEYLEARDGVGPMTYPALIIISPLLLIYWAVTTAAWEIRESFKRVQ